MQIPLIVRAPGIDGNQRRTGLIETIDIYPSLCELTDLPLPTHLEGQSFVNLMKDSQTKWKSAAIGRYRNGDTIRTDALRYTEYTDTKSKLTSRMLYNHTTDPNENVNVARRQPASANVEHLSEELHQKMGRDRK